MSTVWVNGSVLCFSCHSEVHRKLALSPSGVAVKISSLAVLRFISRPFTIRDRRENKALPLSVSPTTAKIKDLLLSATTMTCQMYPACNITPSCVQFTEQPVEKKALNHQPICIVGLAHTGQGIEGLQRWAVVSRILPTLSPALDWAERERYHVPLQWKVTPWTASMFMFHLLSETEQHDKIPASSEGNWKPPLSRALMTELGGKVAEETRRQNRTETQRRLNSNNSERWNHTHTHTHTHTLYLPPHPPILKKKKYPQKQLEN